MLTIIICLTVLLIITIFVINTIIPFIWYQKLDNVANKYVYVIERFGYLTDKEEEQLEEDLKQEGFNIQNIEINCPKSKLDYGTLFKFEIKYTMHQNYSILDSGIKNEARSVPLSIRKYSYSKI